MKNLLLAEIVKLDISERIQLVEDIWDSIAALPHSVELTDSQRQELDRRLAVYHQNPDSGSPWAEVRKRISRIE